MKTKTPHTDDMRAEYVIDYSTAVRGKYFRRMLKEGSGLVLLDPDVAKAFRTSEEVNKGLRALLEFSAATRNLSMRTKPARRATRR